MKFLKRKFLDLANSKRLKGYESAWDATQSTKEANLPIETIMNEIRHSASSGSKPDAVHYCGLLVEKVYGYRPHRSQSLATLAVLDGKFVEMDTGEGKTLVFLMAAVINALQGNRSLVATANDYLAKRDAEFASQLTQTLGITSCYLDHRSERADKQKLYQCQIIYCDLTDVISDFLRSSFSLREEDTFDIPFDALFVDEADNVLIDKGSLPVTVSKFQKVDKHKLALALNVASKFKVKKNARIDDDVAEHEGFDVVTLPESGAVEVMSSGFEKYESALVEQGIVEQASEIYTDENLHWVSLLEKVCMGLYLYERGIDYVILGDENPRITPVNKHTGRVESGQFFNSGVQHTLEAKERLPLSDEAYPFTAMPVQYFSKLFDVISGMSGTLTEDADEIATVYSSDVVVIPRNSEMRRNDLGIFTYKTKNGLLANAESFILEAHRKGQPVLICAESDDVASALETMLKSQVQNITRITNTNLADESKAISKAGGYGAITITTGMSGRGTDIVLGGDETSFDNKENFINEKKKVIAAGGLFVLLIGQQRLSKQDRQVIGRAGRQGDVGKSVILRSLDDKSISTFNVEGIKHILSHVDENDPINMEVINKMFRRVQSQALEMDLKNRKMITGQLEDLETQREIIVSIRDNYLRGTSQSLAEFINKTFEVEISDDEAGLKREKMLTTFDELYESYRQEANELMMNMGIRQMAVSNIKTEIKEVLYKNFKNFIFSLNAEIKKIITSP